MFQIRRTENVAVIRSGEYDLSESAPIELDSDWTLLAEGGPVTLRGGPEQVFMTMHPGSGLRTEGAFRFVSWKKVFDIPAVAEAERVPLVRFNLSSAEFHSVAQAVRGRADGPAFASCDITDCKSYDWAPEHFSLQNGFLNGCNLDGLDFIGGVSRAVHIGREDVGVQREQFSNIRVRNIFVKDVTSRSDYQLGHVHAILVVGWNVNIEGITGENVRSTEGVEQESCLVYTKCHHGLIRGITGQNAGGQGEKGMVSCKGGALPDGLGSHMRVEGLSYSVDDDWPGEGLERADRALLINSPYCQVNGLTSYGGGIKGHGLCVSLSLANCEVRNRQIEAYSLSNVGGATRLVNCRDYDPHPGTSNPGFKLSGYESIVEDPGHFELDNCCVGEYHRVTHRPRVAVRVAGAITKPVHGSPLVDGTIDLAEQVV